MKNRRFVVALCLISPIVTLLWWAKTAASWRPVEIIRSGWNGNSSLPDLSVSVHTVVQTQTSPRSDKTTALAWDEVSGKTQTFSFTGRQLVGVQNGFFWHSWVPTEGNAPLAIKVRISQGEEKTFTYRTFAYDEPDNKALRILPNQNRVVILDSSGLCEWHFQDEKFQHAISMETTSARALSRDGRTFLATDGTLFRTRSAATGKSLKAISTHIRPFEYITLSPYGRYALFNQSPSGGYIVVDTATGNKLWNFCVDIEHSPGWVISDDEQTIFVSNATTWEVRDLQTGALLRRLPLVPNTRVAAASPDGATLYSFSNGALYRQRAR